MPKKAAVPPKPTAGLVWKSPKEKPFQIAGLAWFAKDRAWKRTPVKPKERLPEMVESLAQQTAGAQIRFETDSRRIAVRVRLPRVHGMDHMPATGECGFDCYVGLLGVMRYGGTVRYDRTQVRYESMVFETDAPGRRAITLHFPLYCGVKDVRVGLARGAKLWPPKPLGGRVVVYGTSITQGGCASRPGMCWTNIASRKLGVEFINLGFSGNGRGEPEVARTIAEVPGVDLYILEYEPNCVSTEKFKETLPVFLRILRRAHPKTPILVASRVHYARDLWSAECRKAGRERRAFQRRAIAKLRAAGDKRLFFFDGSTLLGPDFEECAVDGVHPTDLGFTRIAAGMIPWIRKALKA